MKKDAYLLGLLFGDGTMNHNAKNRAYQVWIDQHKKNKIVSNEAEKRLLFLKYNVFKFAYRDKIRVAINSKKFFDLFSLIRKDPSRFFNSLDKERKFEFIAGFYDAEGTHTDRVVIYNKNKELLKKIEEFFYKNQIIGHIYRFPKVFGLQIYRKESKNLFFKFIKAQRLAYPSR